MSSMTTFYFIPNSRHNVFSVASLIRNVDKLSIHEMLENNTFSLVVFSPNFPNYNFELPKAETSYKL